MDLYSLSGSYRRSNLMDDYESMVWTERFGSHGDFEIIASPKSKTSRSLRVGSLVENSDSPEPMIVERRERTTTAEGVRAFKWKGRSLTAPIMEGRSVTPQDTKEVWSYEGFAHMALRQLIIDHCIDPIRGGSADIIPNLNVISRAGSSDTVDVEIPPGKLYSSYKELSDSAKLGFSVELNRDTYVINFIVAQQKSRTGVVLGESLDSLTEVSELDSIEEMYNVAYVWDKEHKNLQMVYPKGATPTSGLNRKVLTVEATDIDSATLTEEKRISLITTRGRTELAKVKRVNLYDAAVTSNSPYVYRRHYWLGDIVKILVDEGPLLNKVVTEYIWSAGPDGIRAYPTLDDTE